MLTLIHSRGLIFIEGRLYVIDAMKQTSSHIHPSFIPITRREAELRRWQKILLFTAATTTRTWTRRRREAQWPVSSGPEEASAESPTTSHTPNSGPSDSSTFALHSSALQSTQSLQSLSRSIRPPHCVWAGERAGGGGCRRWRGRSWGSPSSCSVLFLLPLHLHWYLIIQQRTQGRTHDKLGLVAGWGGWGQSAGYGVAVGARVAGKEASERRCVCIYLHLQVWWSVVRSDLRFGKWQQHGDWDAPLSAHRNVGLINERSEGEVRNTAVWEWRNEWMNGWLWRCLKCWSLELERARLYVKLSCHRGWSRRLCVGVTLQISSCIAISWSFHLIKWYCVRGRSSRQSRTARMSVLPICGFRGGWVKLTIRFSTCYYRKSNKWLMSLANGCSLHGYCHFLKLSLDECYWEDLQGNHMLQECWCHLCMVSVVIVSNWP